jgi:GntR family transcriptional regulator, transcriptional repressor for pyruvate dehydrogenase complex
MACAGPGTSRKRRTRNGNLSVSEFKPINASATYEVVADAIRRAIMLGRFVPGEKLPRERELARQLSVSRATLREAIRILVAEDFVEIRRGATGGTLVQAQKVSAGEYHRLLTEQEDTIENLCAYRLAIETASVRQAASRRTESDLRTLHTLVKRMTGLTATAKDRNDPANLPLFLSADAAFHIGIAQASKNPFFVSPVEEVRMAMWMPVAALFRVIHEDANDHHEAIYQAIEQQDPEAAAAQMIAHVAMQRDQTRQFMLDATDADAKGATAVGLG